MDNEQLQQLHSGLGRANILWGTLLGSLAVYLAVPTLVGPAAGAPALGELGKQLDAILFAIGVATLLGAGGVRRAMLSMRPGGPTQGDRIRAAVSRYLTVLALTFAICESVAILGLVFYLLGGSTEVLFTLTAGAAVAMLLYRPKGEELRRLANTLGPRN
jgi:hypothetical protein